MNKEYLIQQVEKYCRERHKDISDTYKKLGVLYQSVYGTNIVMEMEEQEQYNICSYLEDKGQGFIDRYIVLLNMLKNDL